jgi:2-dehydropantoate 2-reductase
MRIAVVGSGAIGTWIGAALARAGHDVHLVARGAHLEAILRDGVRVTGAEEYAVRTDASGDGGGAGPVDVILLSVKAHDQAGASATVRALLGPDTVVAVAQNGVPWWYFHAHPGPLAGRRVEAVDPGGAITAAIAPERVLGVVVYLGARIAAPGVVEVHPEAGLVLGEPDGSDSPRLRALAAALEEAGFPVRRSPAIRTEIWTKLMGNVAFNPMSMLTRASIGAMCAHRGTRATAGTIMAEAIEIARALDATPAISVPARLAIAERLGDHRTSTLQDLEAGKRLELDAITGAVTELADLVAVAAPTLRTVAALADVEARALGLR